MRGAISLGVFLTLAVLGCSREESVKNPPEPVYEPVRAASAYIALAEKPDATRALLIGDEALKLRDYLSHAGVRPTAQPQGKYDLVIVACDEMTRESCRHAMDYLSSNGVLVWLMDVAHVSAREFRKRLESFAPPAAHLWMPGPTHWVLAGSRTPRRIRLSAMLEVFAREGSFGDFAAAHVTTLAELFASYVGSREDVVPAFSHGDQSALVQPAFFLTKEVPPADWISADDVEKDIAAAALAEMRSMQIVRRTVVEGDLKSLAATDRKGEEAALDAWAKAALRNPNDLFLKARIDRLARNARGFLEVGKVLQAMKCYETIVLITPKDAAAVHNFGMCLLKIGKRDFAERVLQRAKDLSEGMGK